MKFLEWIFGPRKKKEKPVQNFSIGPKAFEYYAKKYDIGVAMIDLNDDKIVGELIEINDQLYGDKLYDRVFDPMADLNDWPGPEEVSGLVDEITEKTIKSQLKKVKG